MPLILIDNSQFNFQYLVQGFVPKYAGIMLYFSLKIMSLGIKYPWIFFKFTIKQNVYSKSPTEKRAFIETKQQKWLVLNRLNTQTAEHVNDFSVQKVQKVRFF